MDPELSPSAEIDPSSLPLPDTLSPESGGDDRSLLQSLLQAVPVGIAVVDQRLRYLHVNDELAAMYDSTPEEMRGKTVFEILPGIAPRVVDYYRCVLETGEAIRDMSINVGEADGERSFSVSYHPICSDCSEESAVTGVSVIVSETTDRIRAEEENARLLGEIQAHRKRLDDLLGSIPGVVWEAWGVPDEADQRINYVSSFIETMLGYTIEEWLETPNFWLNIVHPEDKERAARIAAAKFLDGRPGPNRFRWMTKDGRAIWVDAHSVTIKDENGQPLGMRGVTLDISDQVRAEETLREESAFRRAIETSMLAGVAAVDLEGRLTYVNPAFCRSVGWSEEELVGEMPPYRYWPPEEIDTITNIQGRMISGDVPPNGFELIFMRKNGERFNVLVMPSPLIDSRGELYGWLASVHDITHQKRLQQELQDRADALAEADRRKDEYIAMLAHELRNPLAPLLNSLYILRSRASQDPMLDRVREVMDRQVHHMARLIDDLLDVSRLQRGKIQPQLQPLDLTRLAAETVDDHQANAQKASQSLTMKAPETPVPVRADPVRLSQILSNLLTNALKFTPSGGSITVRVTEGEGKARLSVTDTGIGIDPDLLPHIFDTFIQADRSLDRSKGGLGLGLSLVKGLTELHGGSVSVYSEGRDQGTTFTIELPLDAKAVSPAVPAAEPPGASGPSLNILVIEDQRDTAESLRALLEQSGHRVTVAYNGSEGMEAAKRVRPDVVLCDLGLPERDGYAVARELHPIMPDVPLIAITGYGGEEDRRRSREAGFTHHLTKPMNLAELQQLLLTTVSQKG